MAPKDFRTGPRDDMVAVGRIEPRAARIWARAAGGGPLRAEWWREDGARGGGETTLVADGGLPGDCTAAVRLPGAGGRPLEPLCAYRYRVVAESDGRVVGEGRFETTPASPDETPRRFSIGLMSCHQPFHGDGRPARSASRMLRAARAALGEHEGRFVLQVGDQMYSDFPQGMSLFDPDYFRRVAPPGRDTIHDCTVAEVRQLYQRRYRTFWNQDEWQRLQSEFPCYPILDDHDIVDNWGARPVYQKPPWTAVGEGARAAWFDYQGARMLTSPDQTIPASFHYTFEYGNVAGFVMDIRSTRRAGDGGQLYDESQEAELREVLARTADRPVFLLVLSVPIVHVPRFLAHLLGRLFQKAEDFADRWSSGAHVRDRDRLLRLLHDHQRAHPHQQVILLSGDIHIGAVHALHWEDGVPAFHQFISSPITHATTLPIRLASKLILRANRRIATEDDGLHARVHRVRGEGPRHRRNPYGGMNLGLVEVETDGPGARPRVRLLLYGQRLGRPRCVYRSPPLAP